MRLLNTSTLELHEFIGSDIPDYAILSHRWENEELTLQDLHSDNGPHMAGYSKVTNCCKQAASEGWEYAWIDSCCIDKTSSAELSEAINSMFKWYKDAQVCYVYLCDVESGDRDHHLEGSSFRRSKWFTRGWTLQELLAPEHLIFFNQSWTEIGTKSTLGAAIKSTTDIDLSLDFNDECIAKKMSWAAGRETTRTEDMAYCLMGIFGINMPLLYGEGNKAFLRLQTEIMKTSSDETIFAWAATGGSTYNPLSKTGLLAPSPIFFKDGGKVGKSVEADSYEFEYPFDAWRPPFGMDNDCLRISLYLMPAKDFLDDKCFGRRNFNLRNSGDYSFAFLNCVQKANRHLRMAVLLWKENLGRTTRHPNTYLRVWADQVLWLNVSQVMRRKNKMKIKGCTNTEVFVEQTGPPILHKPSIMSHFGFRISSLIESGFILARRSQFSGPNDEICWGADKPDGPRVTMSERSYTALMFSDSESAEGIIIVVGRRKQWVFSDPRVGVIICNKNESLEKVVENLPRHQLFVFDRISKPLQDGRSVLASVRKGMDNGVKRYLVEVRIDPEGSLPWPNPELTPSKS